MTKGGAVYFAANSQVSSYILGTVFEGNTATENGGAIFSNGANLVVGDSCKFIANSAKNGGAIYANNGLITIYGSVIGENENGNTAENGAGISIEGLANVDISNTQFNSNKARKNGGAIYIKSNAVDLSRIADGVEIDSNESTIHGAGIYLESGVLEVSGQNTKISNNRAVGDANSFGGAIYSKGTLTIRDASLQNNSSCQPHSTYY